MKIYFYKEFGELGYLASYSNHGFVIDDVFYKTVEHYYQSQKFEDEKIKKEIINCKTPKEASIIGRDRSLPLKKNWDKIKVGVMYKAVYEKFKQNPDLLEKLQNTGDAEIIEETKKENFWGCGPNYDGQNAFGKILCKVREDLKNF